MLMATTLGPRRPNNAEALARLNLGPLILGQNNVWLFGRNPKKIERYQTCIEKILFEVANTYFHYKLYHSAPSGGPLMDGTRAKVSDVIQIKEYLS